MGKAVELSEDVSDEEEEDIAEGEEREASLPLESLADTPPPTAMYRC